MAWIPVQYPHFPTNEPLVNAITALAGQDTPQVRQAFYTALLNSTPLMAEEQGENRPILFVDSSKQIVLPIFTDLERLRQRFPNVKRAGAASIHELCGIILKYGMHRIHINPEDHPSRYLDRGEIQALAKGIIPDLSHNA